jgi:hemerythrin
MALHFEWTEKMSVGEETIDKQHQKLLFQTNALIDAMIFGGSSNEVADALHFLESYIDEHLSYEEAYMQKNGFHDYDAHKTMHDNFREKYADLRKKIEAGVTSDAVLIQMEEFLGQWWINHIGHEDRKYYLEIAGAS